MEQKLTRNSDERILIVDDEDFIRNLFAMSLGERYQCVKAENAQQALDLLSNQDFGLVLSDVQMPGLSGVELLRKIVSDFPDVAVIMASAVDRSQRVIDALRIGAFDYLIKPVELDVLLFSVERALERRALLRDGKRYKDYLEKYNLELAGQKAELERLQARLVHSEKMASLGQLAGGVAHELNNPAGFIYSNMESLANYTSGISRLLSAYEAASLTPEDATGIANIKKEINYGFLLSDLPAIVSDCEEGARRIRDIVLNLRMFSRLDEAELKRVDLHAGIDATIRLLSEYYNSNRITLIREYGELPPVDCLAGQINQVWMNLLTNAAQSIGSENGQVRIKSMLENEMVVVQISDTGKGIAPENLTRIFDPFFTTKPVGEGTGLGLSISYGIIETHGGTISVDSEVGRGTTFTTRIPLNLRDCKTGRFTREQSA